MLDVTEIDESETIGNGKSLRSAKLGKLQQTIHQTIVILGILSCLITKM